MQSQPQSVAPTDAVTAYNMYKDAHRRQCAERFFTERQESGLLSELYLEQCLMRMFDWRQLSIQFAASKFCKDLQAGSFAQLSLSFESRDIDVSVKCSTGIEMLHIQMLPHSPPYFLLDPEFCSLTFDGVGPTLSVWDFHELLHVLPGFIDVWVDPIATDATDSPLRSGHACFDSEIHLDQAMATITGTVVKTYELRPRKAVQRRQHRVMLLPEAASQPQCVLADLSLTSALITKLDALSGLSEATTKQVLEAKAGQAEAQLDLRVHYLRSVHHFCFYSAVHASDARGLAKQCGVACLRRGGKVPSAQGQSPWAVEHSARARQALAGISALTRPMPCPASLVEEPLCSRWAAHCAQHTKQEGDGRHRCLLCSKLFKGTEYVEKHILKVHGQGLQAILAEIKKERLHDAYMSAGEGPGWDVQ